MPDIEKFLTQFPSTINFLSAIGSCSAVIVSLWLASRADEPKIDAYISEMSILPGNVNQYADMTLYPTALFLNIKNVGSVPVYFNRYTMAVWRVPFAKRGAIQVPADAEVTVSDIELLPQKQVTISLFSQPKQITKKLNLESFNLKIFPRTGMRSVQLCVMTVTGQEFKARMSKDLRADFQKAYT